MRYQTKKKCERIDRLVAKGATQTTAREKVGVSASTYAKWRRTDIKCPTEEELGVDLSKFKSFEWVSEKCVTLIVGGVKLHFEGTLKQIVPLFKKIVEALD